jgi:hypothetical protein
MKTWALGQLICLMLIPLGIWSQPKQATQPEITIELLPTSFTDGVPTEFNFVFTNVSGEDISIPPPEFDCHTASSNGFIRFPWMFEPANGDGKGIGAGLGSCGPGASMYPTPPLTNSSLTEKWTALHPGESLRITANWSLGFGVIRPGTYTFSAKYVPPKLSSEAERLLSQARIAIPRQTVEMPEQHYSRP